MRVSRDRDDRDGAMRGTVACSSSRANNRVTDREADDGDGEEEDREDGEEKARRKGGGSRSAHGSQQYRSIYRLVMVLAVYVCVSAHVYTTLANSPPTLTRALTKVSAPLPGYPQIPCAERSASLQRRLPVFLLSLAVSLS